MTDANDTFGLPQKKETAEETIARLTAALAAAEKKLAEPEPPSTTPALWIRRASEEYVHLESSRAARSMI